MSQSNPEKQPMDHFHNPIASLNWAIKKIYKPLKYKLFQSYYSFLLHIYHQTQKPYEHLHWVLTNYLKHKKKHNSNIILGQWY